MTIILVMESHGRRKKMGDDLVVAIVDRHSIALLKTIVCQI